MTNTPSLYELQARERREIMEGSRSSLLARAKQYGLSVKDDEDIWKLVRKVHDWEDENIERPKEEARAKRLGVPTRGRFGAKRKVYEISLDCYAKEEHNALLRRYGYTNGN